MRESAPPLKYAYLQPHATFHKEATNQVPKPEWRLNPRSMTQLVNYTVVFLTPWPIEPWLNNLLDWFRKKKKKKKQICNSITVFASHWNDLCWLCQPLLLLFLLLLCFYSTKAAQNQRHYGDKRKTGLMMQLLIQANWEISQWFHCR